MNKRSHKESIPLKQWKAFPKAPTIEGMKVSTRRENKFDNKFNQPMTHIYYKPKNKYG